MHLIGVTTLTASSSPRMRHTTGLAYTAGGSTAAPDPTVELAIDGVGWPLCLLLQPPLLPTHADRPTRLYARCPMKIGPRKHSALGEPRIRQPADTAPKSRQRTWMRGSLVGSWDPKDAPSSSSVLDGRWKIWKSSAADDEFSPFLEAS